MQMHFDFDEHNAFSFQILILLQNILRRLLENTSAEKVENQLTLISREP